MRKIKFRVWDGEKMISFGEAKTRELISYQLPGEIGDEIRSEYGDVKIMQYTGLKDKNGKEIYEGDILKPRQYYIDEYYEDGKHKLSDEFGVVEFKKYHDDEGHLVKEHYGWIMNNYIMDHTLVDVVKRGCEVIGNIYENKDLLK